MLSFLIVKNESLATTYLNVFKAYMMYMIVPVTVPTAESFSKLKLIKNFLQSFMSQKKLSGWVGSHWAKPFWRQSI